MDLDNMMNILVIDDNGDYCCYSSDDDDISFMFSSGDTFCEDNCDETDQYLQYLSRLKDFEIDLKNNVEVNDLVYEILTRVDLETLMYGCRWVCKDWQRLMYETNFKQLYLQKTRTISGYYIQNYAGNSYRRIFVSHPMHKEDYQLHDYRFQQKEKDEEVEIVSSVRASKYIYGFPSLGFMPECVKIVASPSHGIGGLLLCHENGSKYYPCFYVCKPTTLEWIKIPNPPYIEFKFYICRQEIVVKPRLDTSTDPLHYQIIILCCQYGLPRERRWRRQSCILTFDSKTWAWKKFEDVNLPPLSFTSRASGVLVNGALHWFRYFPIGLKSSIFLYHVIEQSWSIIPFNEEQTQLHISALRGFECIVSSKLVDFQGELGLLATSDCWIQLWVATTTTTWKKIYFIDIESHSFIGSDFMDLYTPDIIIMLNDYYVQWYNFKTNTCSTKKLPIKKLRTNSLPQAKKWFALTSDFMPCNWHQH